MNFQAIYYYLNWSTVLKNMKYLSQEVKSAYAIQRGVERKGEVFCFPSRDCIWPPCTNFYKDLID